MRNSISELLLAVIVLVLGTGAEELLPHFRGVAFPLVLTAVLTVAERRPLPQTVLFSLAAGAMTDAVGGMPAMTSSGFFLAAALVARKIGFVPVLMLLVYPLYQLWLMLWLGGSGVSVRMLTAVPLGLVTSLVFGPVLVWSEGKAVLDEED